MLTNNMQQMKG